MKQEPPKIVKVGPDGAVRLPPDALKLLGVEPGEPVKLFLDARRSQLRLERHVEDAWGEAMKPKEQAEFEDLLADQKRRQEEAKKLFDRKIKEPPPKERRPEDNPDYWR
ncbi:MAG: AbrB/MazE/SpoVT family DNA-binding domain-containing protein [Planctomycetota bacterium]